MTNTKDSNLHGLPKAIAALNHGDYAAAYDTAVDYLQTLNQTDKRKASAALIVMGSSLMLANKPAEAIKHFNRARALDSSRTDVIAYLARCYLAVMNMPEAKSAALDALTYSDMDFQGLMTAGVVLSHCHDHVSALIAFQRAVAKSPENSELVFNLACSYKFTGDFEHAEASYERALELNPSYGLAMAGLAEIPNSERLENRVERLEGMPDSRETDEFRFYSLAREYERQHRYVDAFNAFTKSAKARKYRVNYSFEQDRKIFTSIKKSFDIDFKRNTTETESTLEPIFIVGMPRTGTTLLERILSNHTEVLSYGELKYLPSVVKKTSTVVSGNAINHEVFEQASYLDYEKIASDYNQLIHTVHESSPRFTDKLPINYFYVGVVLKAFPKAKILVLRRNPMDTCLSNFRQLFGADSVHQYHTNSIEDTARYYLEFNSLIRHWKTVFGEQIHEVRYEDLVTDPAQTVRSVLNYCGLEWQQGCLDFHKNPQPLATASAYQARQPIYKDSANRAAAYGDLLQPITDIFNESGFELDSY